MMSFEPRDRKILLHLGYHGWLSHEQIGVLEFPYSGKKNLKYSYDMCQRRIREELLENNYINRKYLPAIGKRKNTRKQIPIFRLSAKGAKEFEADTNIKALRPRFSQLKVPHRLEVNQVLIELKRRNLISIDGFQLEKKLGAIRPDAYVKYKIPFCLEIDLSGGEIKEFIQNKWQQYEREFMQGKLGCHHVVWYSSRSNQLYNWIDEVHQSNLIPIYINMKPVEIMKVINYLDNPVKKAVK